jgi:hypothetical protein
MLTVGTLSPGARAHVYRASIPDPRPTTPAPNHSQNVPATTVRSLLPAGVPAARVAADLAPVHVPSAPGFGSRIWMICVRAFGWLTETHRAAMTCVDCSVEGIQAGVSVRNDMPPDPLALRRYDEFGVTWPVPEETVWRVLAQQLTQAGLEVGSAVPEPPGRGVRV